jgi:PDZ domain
LLGGEPGATAPVVPVSSGAPADAARTPQQDEAWRAVVALGADDFETRQQASITLRNLGRASIEPLEHALQSTDPEVNSRALELLVALRGRGFVGIQLQQSDDALGAVPVEPSAEVKNRGSYVFAMAVVNHAMYEKYGVKKAFPAEAAGIEPGDVLLAVNDRPVYGTKDLMREVIAVGPARNAVLSIERKGKFMRVPLLLTRNPVVMRAGLFGEMQADVPPVDLEAETDGSGQTAGAASAVKPAAPATPPAIRNDPAALRARLEAIEKELEQQAREALEDEAKK